MSTPAETPKGVIGAMAVTNEATTTKDLPTTVSLKEIPKYPRNSNIPSKLDYLTTMTATILGTPSTTVNVRLMI